MKKNPSQAEQMKNLQERVREMEAREAPNATQRLNAIEAKLPAKKARVSHDETTGYSEIVWDENHNRFLKGWLDDHLPVYKAPDPPALADVEAREGAGFAIPGEAFRLPRFAPWGLALVALLLGIVGAIFGGFAFFRAMDLNQDMLRQQAFSRAVWNELGSKPSRAELASNGVPVPSMAGQNAPPSGKCLSMDEKGNSKSVPCGPEPIPNSAATGGLVSGAGPCNVSEQVCHGLALELSAPKGCWLRITEITPDAKVLVEGHQENGYTFNRTFPEGASLEVRNGCPGKVYYNVNGLPAHPDNVSGMPDKSEVVDLRL